jgi:glyoxylase-like metal-dependent hydrolase (beta-lactamase superfamily II)
VKRELLLRTLAQAISGTLRDDDPGLAALPLALVPAAGGVQVIRGAGANVTVLPAPEGCLLVDSAFAPLAPAIRALLRPLPGAGRVRWLVNTHGHADHAHGNAALGAGATVVAHAAAVPIMDEWLTPAAAPRARPAVTFAAAHELQVGGEQVRLVHLGPGHTCGDALVHFVDARVLVAGDLFVTYGLPFVDLAHGGTVRGLAEVLSAALRDLPEDLVVVPGHGPPTPRAAVLAFAAALRDCADRVQAALARGWSAEEMAARDVLGPHARLGNPFVSARAFVELLCEELTAG